MSNHERANHEEEHRDHVRGAPGVHQDEQGLQVRGRLHDHRARGLLREAAGHRQALEGARQLHQPDRWAGQCRAALRLRGVPGRLVPPLRPQHLNHSSFFQEKGRADLALPFSFPSTPNPNPNAKGTYHERLPFCPRQQREPDRPHP